MRTLLSCIFIFSVLQLIAAKYEVCELKLKLQKAINASLLPETVEDWLCLIYQGTGYEETTVWNNTYGLFQIPSPKYCTVGDKGGRCNKKCKSFVKEDLDGDITCANVIYNTKDDHNITLGFKNWDTWKNNCTGDISNYGKGC